ncbi:MAG: TonB-dependent receptor plug domain-containing protein, partial [Planctomycetota bacterium]
MLALRNTLALLCLASIAALPARAEEGGERAKTGTKEGPLSLEDVVVTPHRTVMAEDLAEKLLSGADVWDLPLIDNDLMRAVQTHPGVQGGDFSARFGVRGGETDETLVLLDGMELYNPYHLQDFGGAVSIVDLLAVSRAQFYLGGFPSRYGDKLSAVLDIGLRKPADELVVDAGIDLLNAHLFVSRKPILAAARAGYIGLLMGMMDSEESFTPHYGDFLLKIDLGGGFSATGIYAIDTNRIDEPGLEEDVRSRFHNGQGWLKWHKKLQDSGTLDVFLYTGGYSQRRKEGTAGVDDRDLGFAGVKSILEVALTKTFRVDAGADVRWEQGRYDYEDSDHAIDIDTEVDGVSLKGHATATARISSALDVILGSRLLYFEPQNHLYAAPSAAISLSPGNGLTFKAACGVYYQPVDPLHLPVEAGVSRLTKPEKAFHYLAGVQYVNTGAGLNARAEIYYKKLDDLTGFVRNYGVKSQTFQPKDSGYSTGFELMVDQTIGDLVLHVGYTWSVSREKYGSFEFYSDRDQRYAANLGASFDMGSDWSANVNWRYHSGNPYTRVWYEGTGRREGPVNGARLPPYHSLDVRISKVWHWRGMEIQAYLQVLNLY